MKNIQIYAIRTMAHLIERIGAGGEIIAMERRFLKDGVYRLSIEVSNVDVNGLFLNEA